MPVNTVRETVHVDIGGGNFRIGRLRISGPDKVEMIGRPIVRSLKFTTPGELIGFSYDAFRTMDRPADQTHVIFSIAGPVNTRTGEIIKLTNHQDIDIMNIPFCEEINRRAALDGLRGGAVVINDAVAGAYAEFSPMGALRDLKEGDLGVALIVGNGIGGRLFRKSGVGIIEVPGGFEPGHFLMPFSLLRNLGIESVFGDRIVCGCGTVGEADSPTDQFCFEAVANGPALQKMLRFHLGSNDATNEDMVKALQEDPNEPLCNTVLRWEGSLLAHRLEAMQRGFDDQGTITFALIAGVGRNLGQYLITHMMEYGENMSARKQRPRWAQVPQYTVGVFPSDETNLYGNAFYMLNMEREARLR